MINSSDNSNLYYYEFYGVTLQLNRPLSGFSVLESLDRFDIKVSLLSNQANELQKLLWLEKLNWTLLPESDPQLNLFLSKAFNHQATYYKIRYVIQQEFIEYIFNSDGSEIWGFYSCATLLQDTISLLLGYVLGTVMRLRGHLAFHASAITIKERAILLTGDSGAGKSTTAAALSQMGYSILADDIAVLKSKTEKYWVQPGYPCLRLWAKSIQALNTSPQELTRVSSVGEKRYLHLTSDNTGDWRFQNKPVPLAGIYIMGKRDAKVHYSSVTSLSSSEAMTKLIQSVYGSYFLNKEIRADEFQQLAEMVRKVPVRQLSRPNNLNNLAQLCSLIVEDSQIVSQGV